MAAGPWFTVRNENKDWEVLDTFWISNGKTHERGRFEIKTRLTKAPTTERGLAMSQGLKKGVQ